MEKLHGKFGNMVLDNFHGIFQDKTVLITGHTGFQGSWLTLWLKLLGSKIIGYSLEPPTKPSLFETLHLEDDIVHVIGDICDAENISNIVAEYKPQIVFHLAAQSLVQLSYTKPAETFETNVMGTVNILEAIRNVESINACVIMTSDKCYDNKEENIAFKETDPMGGHDPYSASKGATELITNSYRDSFFNSKNSTKRHIGIATARAGNVLGGGDWAEDRIIPDCIRSLLANQRIHVRNPTSIRPWQFVLEPLSGILWLAAKMYTEHKYDGAWNFGPKLETNSVTVKELVELVLHEWKSGDWTSANTSNSNPESHYLKLDSKKAMNQLGWFTIYSINETISKTMSWYKKFIENQNNMQDFTTMQIENYSQQAKQMNIIWATN